MRVKTWFETKIKEQLANGGYQPYIISIDPTQKETEKAVLVLVEYGYCSSLETSKTIWIPKSVVITEEEYEAELKAAEERAKKKYMSGLEYNEVLRKLAKEHGLKNIRQRMCTQTLIQKLKDAGIEIPSKEVA